VVPWLGWRLGCGGGVVDSGFHALAATAIFNANPCIATLARYITSREVKLCGQPLPVDVLKDLREVDTFAPTVVLRTATLVDALAGRKRCWIWRGCALPCCCVICRSCCFPTVCMISFCRGISTSSEVSPCSGCSCCEVSSRSG